jgi:hypothetical protein
MPVLNPTQKKKWRAQARFYMVTAEAYRLNRGYSQRRRVIGYGLSPKADQLDDCSGYVDKVTFYANAMMPKGIHVNSPLGFHFSGWGNTESIQTTVTHEANGLYQIGDIALWGPNDWDTSHTAMCSKAGTFKTAEFSSHGHQSWRFSHDAPETIRLPNFPEHLIGVYRMAELR